MAFGTLLGLAAAKTKIQLESRRRDAKNRDARRHSEVEMAVGTGIGEQDAPLEPLEGMETSQQDRRADAQEKQTSLLGMGWNAAWFTLQTSRDVAVGLYHGGDYVRSILYPPDDKKEQ
ncbi:hypothetical protein PHMEG_00021776 [Phytophthora megakarya]|uniref:Uncharacterized protein n=1 Tax=Phytophthora megakarya TaxID=4795 RepID=A0A225VNC3_9STRA|nr:hypothetical protein PHMEG_00021776 [Phytophthora megakarya]